MVKKNKTVVVNPVAPKAAQQPMAAQQVGYQQQVKVTPPPAAAPAPVQAPAPAGPPAHLQGTPDGAGYGGLDHAGSKCSRSAGSGAEWQLHQR